MYQLNYIYFIDFRNLQIEMHVVHLRQVIVVGTVRRPIDIVVLQILELISKVPTSEAGALVRLCNRPAPDMTDRG
jgi:hypothetical protein